MAMPALFLLSGYLLFRNYDSIGYRTKMQSRFLRLGVPLLAWNFIYIGLYNIIAIVSPNLGNTVIELGINTLSGILSQFNPCCKLAIGPFWYVRAVLILSIAAPVYRWLYGHIHWSILLFVCLLFTIIMDNIFTLNYPIYGISLFVLGGLLSYKGIDLVEWFASRSRFLIPIGLSIMVLGFIRNVCADDMGEPYGIVKFAGVFVIWCCADFVYDLLNKKWVLLYLMPAGFMIYAAHMFFAQIFLHSVGKVICEAPIRFAPVGLIAVIVCFGLAVFMCVVLWLSLNGVCPKALNVLDGKIRLSKIR